MKMEISVFIDLRLVIRFVVFFRISFFKDFRLDWSFEDLIILEGRLSFKK